MVNYTVEEMAMILTEFYDDYFSAMMSDTILVYRAAEKAKEHFYLSDMQAKEVGNEVLSQYGEF